MPRETGGPSPEEMGIQTTEKNAPLKTGRYKELFMRQRKEMKNRLPEEEALQEAEKIRTQAAMNKSERDIEDVSSIRKEMGMAEMPVDERTVNEYAQRERILRGDAQQPTRENYDSGEAKVEQDQQALANVRERLKKLGLR